MTPYEQEVIDGHKAEVAAQKAFDATYLTWRKSRSLVDMDKFIDAVRALGEARAHLETVFARRPKKGTP